MGRYFKIETHLKHLKRWALSCMEELYCPLCQMYLMDNHCGILEINGTFCILGPLNTNSEHERQNHRFKQPILTVCILDMSIGQLFPLDTMNTIDVHCIY